MAGIVLHSKYGLNPTMDVCWICGEPTGDLLLLGNKSKRLTGEEEAPRYVCTGVHARCAGCKKAIEDGVVFFLESTGSDPNDRTGRVLGVSQDFVRRTFRSPGMAADIIGQGIALVNVQSFTEIWDEAKERGLLPDQHGNLPDRKATDDPT